MHGIEKDLGDRARVVWLDIGSEVGRSVAGRYGVSSVPTTLVVDGAGEVVHRVTGRPEREEVVARARAA